jgi:hypothetical protein
VASPRRIRVSIGRVVVNGAGPGARQQVSRALQQGIAAALEAMPAADLATGDAVTSTVTQSVRQSLGAPRPGRRTVR